MKIVELLIDENESLAGGDAIALVEHPAHEADFYAFSADNLLFKDDNNTVILSEEESDKLLLKSNHLKAENSFRFELKLHSAILFLLVLICKQLKYLLQCCLTC